MDIIKNNSSNDYTFIDPQSIWDDLDPEDKLVPSNKIFVKNFLLTASDGDKLYDVEVLYKAVPFEHFDLINELKRSYDKNTLLNIMRIKPTDPYIVRENEVYRHFICVIMRIIDGDKIIRLFNLGVYKYGDGFDRFKEGFKRKIALVNDAKVLKTTLTACISHYSVRVDYNKLFKQIKYALENLKDGVTVEATFGCKCTDSNIEPEITIRSYNEKHTVEILLSFKDKRSLCGKCCVLHSISSYDVNIRKVFNGITIRHRGCRYKLVEE